MKNIFTVIAILITASIVGFVIHMIYVLSLEQNEAQAIANENPCTKVHYDIDNSLIYNAKIAGELELQNLILSGKCKE